MWIVWIGLGTLVAGLLTVSWRLDNAARKRGAQPLSGAQMGRARRARDRAVAREVSQLSSQGMLPTTADAARDIWRGKSH